MRLKSRSGLVASALAVGAIAAPSALAIGPVSGAAIDHSGRAQQEAQSFQATYRHLASISPRVRPNADEQLPASTAADARPDRIAAERAKASPSAPLDRFALVGRNITPTRATATAVSSGSHLICVPRGGCRTVSNTRASTASHSLGFQYDDAAVGAGLIAGLVLLGTAGTLAVRRRSQPRHA